MRFSLLAIGALMLAATLTPAAAQAQNAQPQNAQQPEVSDPDDVKVNQLVVYGADGCPVSSFDEITVCVRLPEDERFRIPPNLRADPNDPKSTSWAVRAQALEYVGRTGIGSCSPVGPGGGIGCMDQLIRQARAERETSDEVNWTRLVEEARQERLSQIDAKSDAVERRLRLEEAP